MRSMSFFKMGMLLVIVFTLFFAVTGCGAGGAGETRRNEAGETRESVTKEAQTDTTEARENNESGYGTGARENNESGYGTGADDIINAVSGAVEAENSLNQDPGKYVNPITRLGGDQYDYEVGGITITCDINIDDYIQYEGDSVLIDLRQMAVDAGWQVEEYEKNLPYEWIPNFTYGMPNGSYIYITLIRMPYTGPQLFEDRVEHITYTIRNIHGDVLTLPNYPITSVQKQSSVNCDYKIIGTNQNRCAISMDEIRILTYMLSVGKIEIDKFDLVHVLGSSGLASTGNSFIIP